MGRGRLFQLFVQLSQNVVHTDAEILFGLVFQDVVNVVGGRLVVAVGSSEFVFGTGGGIQQAQFFRFLGLDVIFGLVDQLFRTGEVGLPDGATGVPDHRFLNAVPVLVCGDDVAENALCLNVILLIKVGLSHHQVGIVNRLDVFLSLEKHGMFVDGFRGFLNHAVHRGVDAGQFGLVGIAIYR